MKRFASIFLSLFLLFSLMMPAFADAPVPIATVEELEKLREDPTGSFRLDADLDMRDVDWKPLDFSGTFDGNGHALLNLTVRQTGDTVGNFWDGNLHSYPETRLAGFFGLLTDATVEDLTLLGVNVEIESEEDCFIGAIAGCAEDSRIAGCSVSGTLTLTVSAKAEGVGGIVGFGGAGKVENCCSDVTLVCIDRDEDNLDEQFLGGAVASGFLDVEGCTVDIKGYVSEHGYVHCGGIMGMHRVYRNGWFEQGRVCGNRVSGFISFFEDCPNRRAYCDALIGEKMTDYMALENNECDFEREELFAYLNDLLPHECEAPVFTEEKLTLDSGFTCTKFSCESCGEYSYLTDYRLPGTEETEPELPEEAAEPATAEAEEAEEPEAVAPVEEGSEEIAEEATEESTEEVTAPAVVSAPEEEEVQAEAEPAKAPGFSDLKKAMMLVFRSGGDGEGESFPLHALVPALLILAAAAVIVYTVILLKRK